MQIEVTAQTIDEYGLDVLTGNTKEDLLMRVAEAAAVGQVVWFKIPDAASSEQRMNVFDHFDGKNVSQNDLERGTNPIENWDGKEIPKGANVEVHECVFPPDAEVLEGETFTCPSCRLQYYPEPSDTRSWIIWVPVAELTD